MHQRQTRQQAILNLVFQKKLTPAQADVMLSGGFRCKVTAKGHVAALFPSRDSPIVMSTSDWALIFEKAENIQTYIANHRRLIEEKVKKNALRSCKPKP